MSSYLLAFTSQAEYRHSERQSARILRQAEDIYLSCPEVGIAIEKDMQQAGLRRKSLKLREEQRKALDDFDYINGWFPEEKLPLENIELQATGRKPTSPLMVYCSLLIASQYKGFDSKEFKMNFPANIDLVSFAETHNKGRIPSGETLRRISEKELSEETCELIFTTTIRYADTLKLDDLSHVIGDSTFVRANSRAASDFETLHILLKGCINYLEQCRTAEEVLMKYPEVERLVRNERLFSEYRHELRLQAKGDSEKAKIKAKILRQARRFCDWAAVLTAPISIDCGFAPAEKLEERLGKLEALLQCLEDESKTDWMGEAKQLSLCDPEARWLVKGERSPVFGYMVQVLASPRGLITHISAPHDNRSDKGMLTTMLEGHEKALGQYPETAIFDDGYTKRFNLDWCQENNINLYLKGANASKITTEAEYTANVAKEQRRLRSRVEGYICRLKKTFGLERLSCRGQSNVNKELYRKAALANISAIAGICQPSQKSRKAA